MKAREGWSREIGWLAQTQSTSDLALSLGCLIVQGEAPLFGGLSPRVCALIKGSMGV